MARVVCFLCIGLFLAAAIACTGTVEGPRRHPQVPHMEAPKVEKSPDPPVATHAIAEPPKPAEVERVTLANYYRIKDGMT